MGMTVMTAHKRHSTVHAAQASAHDADAIRLQHFPGSEGSLSIDDYIGPGHRLADGTPETENICVCKRWLEAATAFKDMHGQQCVMAVSAHLLKKLRDHLLKSFYDLRVGWRRPLPADH